MQNAAATIVKKEREYIAAPTITVGDDSADESISQPQEEKRPRLSNFSKQGG